MVTKYIAYNEKFVRLQVCLCYCQNLGALGQSDREPNLEWPADHAKTLILDHVKSIVWSNLIEQIGWSFLSWALWLV